jgi:iron complex transport system substrate-binding protein
MLGRSVDINSAEKFLFLGPGAMRLGTYMGLQNKLAGIERFEQRPLVASPSPYRTYLGLDFFQKLPVVSEGGPGKMPNLEALIVAKPDVIFTSFFDKNQIAQIESKTGIPVIALSYGASYGGTSNKNLEDIKASLLLIGEISNTQKRAQELVDFIALQENELSKISLPSKSIYIGGVPYKGIQPITSTEVNYPPFELLGLTNSVFASMPEAKGHQFIDLEALLKTNPEIIFIDSLSKSKITEDYQAKKALFDTLQAYQNGTVVEVLGFNNYSTNVENLLLIAWQIASYLGYDISLHVKAQEIFEAFYPNHSSELLEKLDYKLGKK